MRDSQIFVYNLLKYMGGIKFNDREFECNFIFFEKFLLNDKTVLLS